MAVLAAIAQLALVILILSLIYTIVFVICWILADALVKAAQKLHLIR